MTLLIYRKSITTVFLAGTYQSAAPSRLANHKIAIIKKTYQYLSVDSPDEICQMNITMPNMKNSQLLHLQNFVKLSSFIVLTSFLIIVNLKIVLKLLKRHQIF